MAGFTHILDAVRKRAPIHQPALVLVAHPDDEVLGLSVLLFRFIDLTLVHATDGVAGGDRDQRLDELDAALKALGVNVQRHVHLDLPDGQLAANLAQFIDRLSAIWEDHEMMVTHAYEGGTLTMIAALSRSTRCVVRPATDRPLLSQSMRWVLMAS